LIGLAACVPLANELRDPAIRAGLAGVIPTGAAASFLHAFYCQRRTGKKVSIHERGLVCADHEGVRVFLWDEVESVQDQLSQFLYKGMPSYTNRLIKLRNAAGEVLEFGGSPEKIAAIAEAVVGRAGERIGLRTEQRLRLGETVDFGGLRLSAERIETGAGTLAWHELESAALADGRLRLYQRGRQQPWVEIGLRNLVNCQALFRMLQRMVERSRPSPANQRTEDYPEEQQNGQAACFQAPGR
jgi:hypothetical protein